MFCLDSNVVIASFRGRPAKVAARVDREIATGAITIPVVVLFELRYGIERSARRDRNEELLAQFLAARIEILPFEEEDAVEAADIRADLHRIGRPIGPYDLLIAAQARRRGLTLVTVNEREFQRVPNLKTENWAV